MKAVILAGGFGTRLSEETEIKPKPMVEIGDKPILWHIMNIYGHYGFNEFIVCLGYKGYLVKEYFANYFLHQSDVTLDLSNNKMEIHNTSSENWKITLIDTGTHTLTYTGAARALGETGGEEDHVSILGETAPHTHTQTVATATQLDSNSVGGASPLNGGQATGSAGGGGAHNNMPPYIALYFCTKE